MAQLWLPACALFAIACFGNELDLALWQRLPEAIQQHFAVESLGPAYFHAGKASLFFWSLVVLCRPHVGAIAAGLRRATAPDDLRYALAAMATLLALSMVTRCSSLGADYQTFSLAPFAQDTNGINRRILEIAVAHFLHLDGGLFIFLHFALVVGVLMLLRMVFRQRGIELGWLELTSLATASFLIHDFQYPGYPDIVVVALALVLLLVDLPATGRAALTVLALLAHEALAVAVLAPLALTLPRRDARAMLAAMALYGVFWAANFGFDVTAGFHFQVDYYGHSGPELLAARPLTVLAGIVVAYKLLWLPMAAHLAACWRHRGWRKALIQAAPLAAAVGLCAVSYDTSRIAGMGFVTLIGAVAALWERLGVNGRRLLFAANLALPSLYVSPIVDLPLGAIWMPGLYALYHGSASEVKILPPALPPPAGPAQ